VVPDLSREPGTRHSCRGHRLQEPISFPHRIAWFLGWRMAYAPHPTEAASICRGVTCTAAPTMPEDSYTDRSMLFQSSLSVTW